MEDIRVVSGTELGREVRWVHTWPEVLPWPHGGELLLTTGYSWPADPGEQRRILRELNHAGVAAILFRAGGPFFPTIPTAILEESAALGIPILEAGENVAFADLMEVINREIIRSQYEIIERSDRIHRAIAETALQAQTVADIAGHLSELLGKEVIIVDRAFKPLSALPPGSEAALAALQQVPLAGNGTRRVVIDALGEVACLPVYIGRDPGGFLLLAGRDGSVTELDLRAGEHGAVVVGLYLLRQQALAEAELRVRGTFVEAVLQGRLSGDPALRERAQLLGFDSDGEYVVAVATPVDEGGVAVARALVSPDDFHLRSRLGRALQAALETLRLPVFTAFSLNQVILVIPVDSTQERTRHRVRRLVDIARRELPAVSFAVTVGRPGRGDVGIPASLRDAEAALAVARGEDIWFYTDLLILRILDSATDRDALHALYATAITPLKAGRGVLYRTARALVATGFRQRETARILGIHWNTLRHRIERIEQLLGARLEDSDFRLRLQFAFEVEKVLDQAGADRQ